MEGFPMTEIVELQQKAARAERLARAVMDQRTTDALMQLADEYRTRADRLRAMLVN
jgi:hypothetical protein